MIFNNVLIDTRKHHIGKLPVAPKEDPDFQASILADTIFKRMMIRKVDRKYICKLISVILDLDYDDFYENVSFLNNELVELGIKYNKKADVVLEYRDVLISIEINTYDTLARNICYTQTLMRHQMSLNSKNIKLRKVIQINFNNFYHWHTTETIEEYHTMNRSGKWYYFQSFVNVSLPLLNQKDYTKLEGKERLIMAMFTTSKEKIEYFKGDDEDMKEYYENVAKLVNFNELCALDKREAEEAVIREEGREEGLEKGREEGLQEGIKKGIVQTQKKTVLRMKSKGLSLKEIQELTGLAQKVIKNFLL